MRGVFFGLPPRQELARQRLDQLAASPPQVLVIEGGTAAEREAAALYHAAAVSCGADGACGVCDVCQQVRDKVWMDLIFLDGAEQSIKVDDIREVRRKVGEPPRGPGYRVVVLTEAQSLTLSAANALLKSMEEPRPGNCFVLLAPQRERLIPTLVSRSWVLTLAWPEAGSVGLDAEEAAEVAEWLDALERFWRTGHGFLGRRLQKPKPKAKSKAKSKDQPESQARAADQPGGEESAAPDTAMTGRNLAQAVVQALSAELAHILAGRRLSRLGELLASRLDLAGLRRLDLLLENAQEALIGQVNPSLTLEWLATRIALWLR
jgi:DNA polymerase-3 subunit delta'